MRKPHFLLQFLDEKVEKCLSQPFAERIVQCIGLHQLKDQIPLFVAAGHPGMNFMPMLFHHNSMTLQKTELFS